MGDELEVIYTNEGMERLKRARDDFTKLIENVIKNYKYAPGDKVLEITASDIEYATQHIKFIGKAQLKDRSSMIISRIYIILGLAILMYGLIREFNAYINIYIMMGIGMILVGYLAKDIFIIRDQLAGDLSNTFRKLK